jgi:hypothetical protein
MMTMRTGAQYIPLTGTRSSQVLAIGNMERRHDDDGSQRRVDVYDSLTNLWSHDSDMVSTIMRPIAYGGAIAIDSDTLILYQFGGVDARDSETISRIQCYNPATKVWSLLTSTLNQPRESAVAIYIPQYRGFIIAGRPQ